MKEIFSQKVKEACFFILFMSFVSLLQAEVAPDDISPVYEQLLANKTEALRRERGRKQDFVFVDAAKADEEAIRSAVKAFKQKNSGILIVFHVGARRAEGLRSMLSGEGLKTIEDIRESELEFVKGPSGRQVLDLSDPKAVEPVYERLVREGLNPVQAWPSAEEAIRRFRSSEEKILVAVQ